MKNKTSVIKHNVMIKNCYINTVSNNKKKILIIKIIREIITKS